VVKATILALASLKKRKEANFEAQEVKGNETE